MTAIPSSCLAHPNGPPLHAIHSNSMTHLHQQCVAHPSQNNEQSRAGSMHELRFGPLPSKVYTSEPDLRVGGSIIPPVKHSPPHTIISQSPTKGKIKSKKRNRAPPPPLNNDGTFSDGYLSEHSRIHSEGTRAVHWGTSDTQSRPASQVSSHRSKSKNRKIGLFKKKNESRKSDESSFTDDAMKSKPRSTILSSSDHAREQKRERARSVDCIQHELRLTSPHTSSQKVMELTSSSEETTSSNERENHRRSQTIERDSRRRVKDEMDLRLSTTMERNPKNSSRGDQQRIEEHRSHSRGEERLSYDAQQNRNYINNQYNRTNSYGVQREKTPLERRASSTARTERSAINVVFDEWEEAEKDMLRRKKISDSMKHELLTVAKNMKKSSENIKPELVPSRSTNARVLEDERKINLTHEQSKLSTDDKNSPKTFFFGMEPVRTSGTPAENSDDLKLNSTPVSKIIQMEAVRIEGAAVGYSKRNNEIIEQSRSRNREKNISKISHQNDKNVQSGKENNEIDQFAVIIERNKHNFNRDNLFANSMRREDGGYHSRQNSGSFHLENENPSDEDLGITANMRPILPKRQREIPRFSPNAAWRFLGEEPFLADENNLNESRSSEEVDVVFEDKIRGYSRPVAPPRGSGEKSADSGISGDAGSPGPMQEFEPIVPSTSIKIINNGPLAASSPVASGRSEPRRTWTPAQDLDDNSLDGRGESPAQRALQASVLTPPKLTSRANMFTIFGVQSESKTELDSQKIEKLQSQTRSENQNKTTEEGTQTMNNFRKLKRSVSGSINAVNNFTGIEIGTKLNAKNIQSDKWRDNWSMTRSIPNSLNNCEESDIRVKNSNKLDCSKSDLNPSPPQRLDITDGPSSFASQPRRNPYKSGHIVYLPEYTSRKIPADQDLPTGEIRSRDLNSSKHLNRSYTADERIPHLTSNTEDFNDPSHISLPHMFPGSSPIGGRMKKSKKFSYQSTVRVLEKRKIEAKLNREIEAKEQQRLQEAAAMRQVIV